MEYVGTETSYNPSSSNPFSSGSTPPRGGSHLSDDAISPFGGSGSSEVDAAATRISSVSLSNDEQRSGSFSFTNRNEKIVVEGPEVRGGTFSKHHAYKISVQPSTSEPVFRRYNDFLWLRSVFARMFPGLFVPPIPPKKILGSNEEEFLNERRSDFQRFLRRVSAIDILYNSHPMQKFLFSTTDFETTTKEINKQLDARDLKEVFQLYNNVFGHILAKPITEKTDQDMESFKGFLKSTEKKVEALYETSRYLTEGFGSMMSNVAKLNGLLGSVYDEEKTQISDKLQPDRFPVLETFLAWHQSLKFAAPCFTDSLQTNFKYELQDVQSFLELIGQRDEQKAKLEKAKKAAAPWKAGKQPTPKQEQQKIDELKKEEEEQELLDIMTKLIVFDQIHVMWQYKTCYFHTFMHDFAVKHHQASQQNVELWATLQANIQSAPKL